MGARAHSLHARQVPVHISKSVAGFTRRLLEGAGRAGGADAGSCVFDGSEGEARGGPSDVYVTKPEAAASAGSAEGRHPQIQGDPVLSQRARESPLAALGAEWRRAPLLVHPGGKTILEVVQRQLGASKEQVGAGKGGL